MGRPRSKRRCSRCAAIDFRAVFRGKLNSVDLDSPSTWKPHECDACDFFLRSLGFYLRRPRSGNTELSALDESVLLLGNRTSPPRVAGTISIGFNVADRFGLRDFVRSPVYLGPKIYTTPPTIDWHFAQDWVRQDTIKGSHVGQEEVSLGHTLLYPGLPLSKEDALVVIDCKSRKLVTVTPETDYVTLSYVWGSQSNALGFDCAPGLSLPRLPPTIEDSMYVCLKLGYQHLWVDRYCIPQTNATEKYRIIQRMDDIYADSTLTIVACAGNSPQYGLPGVSRLRERAPGLSVELFLCLLALPVVDAIHESVWARRGWTYQEALLSQRRLYFTDSQLYFEGFGSVRCEWAATKPEIWVPWIFSQLELLKYPEQIYDCIVNYSKRELSFEGDRLSAISGILASFARRHRMRHIWGMPYMSADESFKVATGSGRISLRYSLCFDTPETSSRLNTFPSWSWLGWKHLLWPSTEWPDHAPNLLTIWPELSCGSIISWSDYDKNYNSLTRYDLQLSHFIHIRAYMSSIVHIDIVREHSEYTQTATIELADGTKLVTLDGGRVLNRVKHCLLRLLLVHMPRWHSRNIDLHLLVEDCGDHWERVHLIHARCESCHNYLFIQDHTACRLVPGPPGTLRTIRLG